MSFWVSLLDTTKDPWCDESCPEPCYPAHTSEPFEDGGTYAIGGSDVCELNITYNYSPLYYRELDKDNGLRALDKQVASATVTHLEAAVKALGTERDDDYWKATAGNAGAALARLLAWAKAYPEGIWRVA